MGSIVFVHGTGVRQESYKATFNRIQEEIRKRLPAWSLEPCFWGEEMGAKLHKNGASIPNYQSARAVGAVLPIDEEIALWRLLYADSLYELRIFASGAGDAKDSNDQEELPPGSTSPAAILKKKLEDFKPSNDLSDLLMQNYMSEVFTTALKYVVDSEILEDVFYTMDSASGGDYSAAIARAVVAETVVTAEQEGIPLFDSKTRDQLINALIAQLGGTERGIRSWIGDKIKDFALRVITNKVERKRGAISDGTFPLAGDIIMYQTRGESIRQFIGDKIMAASEPRYILSHSLGGIACVDLLVEKEISVAGLITVGSQAPLLYELDSLISLRVGEDLPPHFPKKWLNFYDPQDFLGYIGEGVFPGRVKDVRVNSNQPFPQSHSAYWSVEDFWANFVELIR